MKEVSSLSQHFCSPSEGYLYAVYKIFRYLQKNISKIPGRISFNPSCVTTDDQVFEGRTRELEDWNEFCPDAVEAHSRKDLEPFEEPVIVRFYVYANHLGNLAKRRSQYGILIYVNNALITFYSKRQNTVEASSFGSDSAVLRTATETVEVLMYKLSTFC